MEISLTEKSPNKIPLSPTRKIKNTSQLQTLCINNEQILKPKYLSHGFGGGSFYIKIHSYWVFNYDEQKFRSLKKGNKAFNFRSNEPFQDILGPMD